MVAPIELGVLFQNGVITRFERLPDFVVARRNIPPRARVAASAMIRAAMRNRLFDRVADLFQVVRKIAGV